jgi:lysophospholipase L1-like esterase
MNVPRIGILTTTAAMLLALLLLLPAPALAAGRIRYTALGDSIAAGYGATNHYGYVDYFDYYLEKLAAQVRLSNDATPGLSSSGLLIELRYYSSIRDNVRAADVVTISIGGNNLLPCASNNYSTLNTLCAEAGVAAFKYDWPRILATIRTDIGARGQLLVLTLYNPYRGDEANYATADTYIKQINATLQNSSYTSTYGYKVADAYTDFQGKLSDGTWKVCTWTHFCEAVRDPHPTDKGHQELARLHQPLYSSK